MTVIFKADYTDTVIFYDAKAPKTTKLSNGFLVESNNLLHLTYTTMTKNTNAPIFEDFIEKLKNVLKPTQAELNATADFNNQNYWLFKYLKPEMMVKYYDATKNVALDGNKYKSATIGSVIQSKNYASFVKTATQLHISSPYSFLSMEENQLFAEFKEQTVFARPIVYDIYLKGGETANIISITLQTTKGDVRFDCMVVPNSLKGSADLGKHIAASKQQSLFSKK